MTDETLRLPFDQYQRYRMVADVLDRLRGDKPLTVLDVGGRTALLCRFIDRDKITLVDVEPSDVTERMVLGDGSRLPFKDDAFDVVCAFDTLEHVPPAGRRAFVDECTRVANHWCILAGPYAQSEVARGEELLRRFLADKLHTTHRYLDEHSEHGLPDRAEITTWLESAGARVACVGHGNLHRWLFMMCVELFLDDDPSLRAFAGDVYAYYNESLYASDTVEPVYRHVVMANMQGEDLPNLDALAGDVNPNALRETLAPIALMTSELTAFERERTRWRVERDALREIVEDREQQLAEHEKVSIEHRTGLANLELANRVLHDRLNWLPVKVLVRLRKAFGG